MAATSASARSNRRTTRSAARCHPVADSGIGIPRDKIGKLFQPFAQLAGSQSRSHGGLGLGLVNTKRIIEAYGGAVWLGQRARLAGTVAYVQHPQACAKRAGDRAVADRADCIGM